MQGLSQGIIRVIAIFYITAIASESAFGLAMGFTTIGSVITSVVASWLSDKVSRHFPVRIALLMGLLMLYLATLSEFLFLILLFLTLGIIRGLIRSTKTAYFADATVGDMRDTIYSLNFSILRYSSGIGAFIAGFMLLSLGDESLASLKIVFLTGIVLQAIALLFIQVLKDIRHEVPLTGGTTKLDARVETIEVGEVILVFDPTHVEKKLHPLKFTYNKAAKWLILISGAIVGLGAGITIPFFSLFLNMEYKMSISDISFFNGIVDLAIGLGSVTASMSSKVLGRVKVIMFSQFFAIIALIMLMLRLPLEVVLVVLFVRSVLMNANIPLSTTVLMESVSTNQRARWSAMNAISQQSTRSLGQMMGGFMLEAFYFDTNFLITAILYSVAVSMLLGIKEQKDNYTPLTLSNEALKS